MRLGSQPRASLLALGLVTCLAAACGTPAVHGQADSTSSEPFSHADWRTVLERFVDARGLVDYRGLAEHREVFDRYLASIRTVSPESAPERFPGAHAALAYYLNAYNAMVFEGVLTKGPDLDSVWGWTGTGAGFFVGMKITIGGRKTNLKKLEDDVVRAQFHDPRIHAALNCASLGCPRLPQEPFLDETLDAQLDAAMMEFVARPDVVQVDSSSGSVTLSKIFDWFAEDFLAHERSRGAAEPSVIGYVNRCREPSALIPLGSRVEFAPYDKRLNSQP